MHILFRHVGQFIVEDVAHRRDVEAAGRDIGRHQHLHFAGAEARERAGALGLAAVAVDGFGRNLVRRKLAHNAIGAMFGAGENDGAAHVGLDQQMRQQRQLFRLGDMDHRLHHALGGGGGRLHGNLDGVLQIALGHVFDGWRQRGGEQHRLALLRQQAGDALQIMDEAQIKHLIAFIEHQHFDMTKVARALHHQIEQTARGGHQHINTREQRAFLAADRHAAEHAGH